MTTYSDSTKSNKKDYQIEKLTAERDALQNEVARVKRIANANLGNGWTEQQRGNRYRNRALALPQQAAHHRTIARVRAIGNEALDVCVGIVTREKARAVAAETQLAAAQAEAGKLRAALKGIQQMATEELRTTDNDTSMMYQIEADARAALGQGAGEGSKR